MKLQIKNNRESDEIEILGTVKIVELYKGKNCRRDDVYIVKTMTGGLGIGQLFRIYKRLNRFQPAILVK